jgi:hypothetical protein
MSRFVLWCSINSADYIRLVMNCEKNSFVVEGIWYLSCICNLFNDAVNSSDHAMTSKAL